MKDEDYKIKLPEVFFKDLENVQKMYFEDLENDDEDCLGGTEDSYANEMLGQHLADILDNNTILKIKEINTDINNYFGIDGKQDGAKQMEALFNQLVNDFADNIETIDTTYERVLDINDKTYYYDMDILKAKQDYQKVTKGRNLAGTFERREER